MARLAKARRIASLSPHMVALIIEADPEWRAYKPNSWDDSYWTVDRGDDWKIRFTGEFGIELIYRYMASSLGNPLFAYLCERMGWVAAK